MAKQSDLQLAAVGKAAGFSGTGLINAIAVALAESGGESTAKHTNTDGSIDRGLWQINSKFHSEVTDACAFDPACAAKAAFTISSRGTNWTPWTTFNSGAYRTFLARAQAAVATSNGPTGTPTNPATGASGGVTVTPTAFTGQEATTETVLTFGTASGANFWGPFQYVVAFAVMGALLWGLSRFKAGYVALYYGEALILFFLFATQAQFFRESLMPFLSKQPTENADATPDVVT